MTLYNLIDFFIFVLIVVFIIYSYNKKQYLKVFEYLKLFIFLTISAKLASFTAIYLQKFYITKADTYTILLLISFAFNFILLYYFWKYIIIFIDKFVSSSTIKSFLAKVFTVVEVTIIFTFSLYLIMQLAISKKYLYEPLYKTFLYPKIERFYTKFINDDFVMIVLTQSNPADHKEILFNSFKNSF